MAALDNTQGGRYDRGEGMARNFIVISLGGSLIVPHLSDEGGINVPFLKSLREFLRREIKKEKRFVIVAGGGRTARMYQKTASETGESTSDDLDWIGIYATRLNAYLLYTIFKKEAYRAIIDREPSIREVQRLQQQRKNVLVASGWQPGQSTDHVAMRLAYRFGAKEIINASNIPFVYDKDPKIWRDAKPIREISWREYRKLIPVKWTPGLSCPVDPIAAHFAEKQKLTVKTIQGTDLQNFKRAIEGKDFQGTLIF